MSCYDVTPDEPETYESLRDGEDNTGVNNIQEQQSTHSSPDDEGNAPEPPPPRHPMYLELLDDESNIASNNIQEQPTDHPMYLELVDDKGKAPDIREDIDTSIYLWVWGKAKATELRSYALKQLA